MISRETVQIGRQPLAAMAVAMSVSGAVLTGCGGSDDTPSPRQTDEAAIRKVLNQLQQASVAGDGNRICTQIFTPKLANSVTKSARSGSCAKEVRKNVFSPTTRLAVQDINVSNAANATAVIKEASNKHTSTIFFVRQSGRWRIRSIQPA